MKLLEFWAYANSDYTLRIPPEVAAQIQQQQSVRVILLVSEPGDDPECSHLATEQFLRGYTDSDAIYNEL